MFERLGRATYRLRFLVVFLWIVAAIASAKFAPSIASSGATDQGAFLPAYAPSAQAAAALDRAFPGTAASGSVTLTFSRAAGLTDADHAYVGETGAWITSASAPSDLRAATISVATATSRPELASALRSSDRVLELLTVDLNVSPAGDAAEQIVKELRAHLAASAPPGLETHVTGAAGITSDYLQAIRSGTDSTTAVTIALVLILLLLIYRAPLAALVPLATIGAAFIVARGVLGLLAAAGWQISSLLDTFTVVLVFGVGTDYAIFLVSRYREELRHEDWHIAVRETVKRIGAVISASAATVVVGLATMAFADYGMIRTVGPALAIAVAVTLIAGLTLAPALLGIFGHYLFWPLHERRVEEGEPGGFFARLAAAVSRRPGIVTAAILVALAIPIAFVPQAKTNFDQLADIPATADSKVGYDVISTHLGSGKIAQATGLIDVGSGDVLAPTSLAHLRDTLATVKAQPGIGTVTSLITPNGDGVVPDGFRPSVQLGKIADAYSSRSDGTSAGTTTAPGTSASSSSATGSTSSALLDGSVSKGLSDTLDYVSALGAAFPEVGARSEYRNATGAIENAESVVSDVRAQSVVSTQLRTLASALTSPTSLAPSGSTASSASSASSSGSPLIANYLVDLVTAYPEVRALPAFDAATTAAVQLARKPTVDAAVAASNALQSLARHFDAQPNARLSPKSLENTESAKASARRVKAAFDALPGALTGLQGVFAGRSDDLFIPIGLGGSSAADIQKAVDAFVSKDRTATRFYVTTTDDPYSTTAFATMRTARDSLASAASTFGPGASAYLNGATAQLADVQDVLSRDFERVGIITVLGIFLVLVLLLRALVAPIYLVATVLVSYGSALGISVFLFEKLLGQTAGISFFLPLLVFVLLVALGADYNIFLMSRVREESETRPIRDGVRIASGRTGGVITSAGLILAGTFGSMATAPLVVLFQIGVAVALGVLIDTFVVRSILVPAITSLVGDRAWWPSRPRHAVAEPVPVAPAEPIPSAAPQRRLGLRYVLSLLLALLVPVAFAGLLAWSYAGTVAPTPAAVVNLDRGAVAGAADGSNRTLQLGRDLADRLVAGGVTSTLAWRSVDAADAADGIDSGRYGAVLTIPADFSQSIAAIQADPTGGLQPARLSLKTGTTSGTSVAGIADALRTAIAAAATRDATASYVEDVLLAVTTSDTATSRAASDARSVANRASSIASDASGTQAVAAELVAGLDQLAAGVGSAAAGASKLAAGTKTLADGAGKVAVGATSLASGAVDASTGAASLADGANALASGLADLSAGTAGLPGQTSQLATGAADLSTGVASAASGAASLASGLATMRTSTAGLSVQTQALAQGAADLSSGSALVAQNAAALASGAASLSTGIAGASSGATSYMQSLSALALGCGASGADATYCANLAGLAGSGTALAGSLADLTTGASSLATGATGIAQGAAAVAQGAAGLASGTGQLAAGIPALEAGIASASAGSAALSTGLATAADGATRLAVATRQLADGIVPVTNGIASAANGAIGVRAGATKLAGGIGSLAAGAQSLATGAGRTAAGARQIASGTASAASGSTTLQGALAQLAAGAKVVQSRSGLISGDVGAVANDAGSVASSLETTAGTAPAVPAANRSQVAALASDPVAIDASTVADGSSLTAVAPVLIAIGLWLGAIVAFLVMPSGRRPRGLRRIAAATGTYLATAVVGAVGALLALGALVAVLGLAVAEFVGLVLVTLLAVATFAALAQLLVTAFGRVGWLLGVLAAALQVAASGYPVPTESLPEPLAALHPFMPVTWAADAIRACILGSGDLLGPVALLGATLVLALLATLAVAARPTGSEAGGMAMPEPLAA